MYRTVAVLKVPNINWSAATMMSVDTAETKLRGGYGSGD
jgi:hypothetical protein